MSRKGFLIWNLSAAQLHIWPPIYVRKAPRGSANCSTCTRRKVLDATEKNVRSEIPHAALWALGPLCCGCATGSGATPQHKPSASPGASSQLRGRGKVGADLLHTHHSQPCCVPLSVCYAGQHSPGQRLNISISLKILTIHWMLRRCLLTFCLGLQLVWA